MEFATNSSALHLFPTDQRFKIKGGGCRSIDPQILSRIGRDDKERYGVTAAPKKRQHSDEENPPLKRQKKTIEVDSTSKAKSRTVEASLRKTVSESKQETKTKVTKPVGAIAITTRVTKPEKSIRASKACPQTKPDGIDLRNLITKAQHKIKEKRQIDHRYAEITRRRIEITNRRIAARIAINQVVKTVDFENHLKYHWELGQLGCTFIHDQVDCLNMFKLLSRSDYNDPQYSVLENFKTP